MKKLKSKIINFLIEHRARRINKFILYKSATLNNKNVKLINFNPDKLEYLIDPGENKGFRFVSMFKLDNFKN